MSKKKVYCCDCEYIKLGERCKKNEVRTYSYIDRYPINISGWVSCYDKNPKGTCKDFLPRNRILIAIRHFFFMR